MWGSHNMKLSTWNSRGYDIFHYTCGTIWMADKWLGHPGYCAAVFWKLVILELTKYYFKELYYLWTNSTNLSIGTLIIHPCHWLVTGIFRVLFNGVYQFCVIHFYGLPEPWICKASIFWAQCSWNVELRHVFEVYVHIHNLWICTYLSRIMNIDIGMYQGFYLYISDGPLLHIL